MQKIAIVGSGIAGMTCAYFLSRKYEVTLFEKNDYVGGHTNTVTVEEDGREVPVDTGFMVYNEVTYPNLVQLFRELKVPVKKTSMSFSVQHVPTGLEFCGSSFNKLFSQRRNVFNIPFLRMLLEINRFNRECGEVLRKSEYEGCTIGEYARSKRYGDDFMEKYLIPMSSAVWSTSSERMEEFPAATLVRFFTNHGFLGLNTQHQWWTVQNGSKTYREALIKPFEKQIRIGSAVVRIVRADAGATVMTSDGEVRAFDRVVLACHADEALRMLANPTTLEQSLLRHFEYQKNRVTLHTDASIMPRSRRAWSSWNHRSEKNGDGSAHATTIYWMNSLQGVSERKNYFVSVNDVGRVRDELVLKEMQYTHPLLARSAVQSQKDLPRLNQNGIVYYCGSYFKYGFHEDALVSALDVCRQLGCGPVWN